MKLKNGGKNRHPNVSTTEKYVVDRIIFFIIVHQARGKPEVRGGGSKNPWSPHGDRCFFIEMSVNDTFLELKTFHLEVFFLLTNKKKMIKKILTWAFSNVSATTLFFFLKQKKMPNKKNHIKQKEKIDWNIFKFNYSVSQKTFFWAIASGSLSFFSFYVFFSFRLLPFFGRIPSHLQVDLQYLRIARV